jgi:uncharacterized integral membrane protein
VKFLGRVAGVLLIVAFAMLSIIFVELNPEETELAIGAWRFSLPMGAWIVLSFVFGAVFTWLASLPLVFRLRWRLKRLPQTQGEE